MPINIHAVDAHADTITELELPPSPAPGERVPALVEVVKVVGQRCDRNQTFNKKIVQFDKKAEVPNVGDHPVELFAQALGHEDGFAPLVNLVFSGVGGPLALARFFGDQLQFAERNRGKGAARLFFGGFASFVRAGRLVPVAAALSRPGSGEIFSSARRTRCTIRSG